jgi:nucleoside-diphosphate-sugar epimerase
MRILFTGCEGYLGSLLGPELLRHGHDAIGVDTGFYRERTLFRINGGFPRSLTKDVRELDARDLEGVEAVVHMAELSNDPVGQLAPAITYEINHQGAVRLAALAKRTGVRRFIYTSSCSVYGIAGQDFVDETSPLNPQTAYAKCKTLVERDVRALADDRFCPVFLRNATAYGASPHMRFDIVLNNLAGLAWTTHEVKLTSDGTPWRPLVHALDIVRAILAVIEAPTDVVHNQVFNVGNTEHNYRIREIAEIVGSVFPDCRVTFGPPDPDNRSYRVSFEKIRKYLPAFQCTWDARRGACQLLEVFRRVDMQPEGFHCRAFTRLKAIEYLIRTQQIDDHFFWKEL